MTPQWIGLTAEGDRVGLGSSLTHRTVVTCTQFTMRPPPFSPLVIIGWHSSEARWSLIGHVAIPV